MEKIFKLTLLSEGKEKVCIEFDNRQEMQDEAIKWVEGNPSKRDYEVEIIRLQEL